MRNLLLVTYLVFACYTSVTRAVFRPCDSPKKVADEEEFKLIVCENSDSVCMLDGGGIDSNCAYKYTAPEGKTIQKSDLQCNMTFTSESGQSYEFGCEVGEQNSIDEFIYNPTVKPIKGGETRYINCYCDPYEFIPFDVKGTLRAELVTDDKEGHCYVGKAQTKSSGSLGSFLGIE